MTVAQQNHNHFQNSNRMMDFVQSNTESIDRILKSDHSEEHKLQMVEFCNTSAKEMVAKWKEVIYQGPYTADEISLFLLLDSFESKKA